MATSGSTNFSLNRNEIISAMLRKIRVLDPAETASANDITTGSEALNLLVKAWQMKGLALWYHSEVVLHLEKDAQSYSLGPTGDHCCLLSDAVKTQLAVAAAASATALTVDSNTGIIASDNVGVELDDDTLHWSTQSGAPAGSTDLTLASGVASAAAIDNYVFAYTSKISRPLEIIEARLRDSNNNDEPLRIHTSEREFKAITDKTSSGDVTDLLLVPHIGNSLLYTWPVADNVSKRIVMTVKRVVEDFDGASDNFDGPPEALRALIWNGAVEIAPEYAREVTTTVAAMATTTYQELESFYRSREPIYLMPAVRRR